MTRARIAALPASFALLTLTLASPATTEAQTPKSGGVLNMMLREDLAQGFAIHETATISTVWPAMPCFNNLVLFDPLKKTESVDTVIGELAEKWSWQDNFRNLVFFLRKGVKWHDGQPFTAKDVKFTFDMLREAADAPAKLRINPRKDWYANIEAIEVPDPFTVVFRLKKPQPSLLLMLASGYTPVYNPKVRLAVSYAIDRRALVRAVHQGGAVVGASLAPRPWGFWGLGEKDLLGLPGYAVKPADEKAKARRLMAELGFTPEKPLRVEIVTRAIAIYVDMASFVINELKQIGIDASLKQIETAQWHAMATRGDYQIGANLTGIGPDDPDANFYENYACGSPRNYGQYCSEEVMKLIDAQSQELDPKRRLAMVYAIQRRLEADAARPILDWKLDYFTVWPHVKNLIPHQSIYNFGRMQEVWIDK